MLLDYLCPICGNEARIASINTAPSDKRYSVNCETCGAYMITETAREHLMDARQLQGSRIKLSSLTRERTINGLDKITLFYEDSGESLITPRITLAEAIQSFPKKLSERLDKALLNIAGLSKFIGDAVELDKNDYPIFYPDSTDSNAVNFILQQLIDDGLVSGFRGFPTKLTVTTKGWNRIYELEKGSNTLSNQGFVAMWFDKRMENIWKNGIEKAIKNAGYMPKRIDRKEHNNKICDEIIAEIKKSKFLVCDFTGQRAGVYFEAGFALGLGLPVIWTCKNTKEELEKLHFDTRQYNHILWDDADDLYIKLLNRIRATIN